MTTISGLSSANNASLPAASLRHFSSSLGFMYSSGAQPQPHPASEKSETSFVLKQPQPGEQVVSVQVAVNRQRRARGVLQFIGRRIIRSRGERGKESLNFLGIADGQPSNLRNCKPDDRDHGQRAGQSCGGPPRCFRIGVRE